MSHPATPTAPAAPPAVETIKVKVDGREIDVPKMMPDWQGRLVPTTMLQACHLAGAEVPTTATTRNSRWRATAACAW